MSISRITYLYKHIYSFFLNVLFFQSHILNVSPSVSLGVVQTLGSLDYENVRTHNLSVRARDPVTGGYTDAQVTISVMDVNDNPPVFSSQVFKAQVSEAASPGHVVVQVNLILSVNRRTVPRVCLRS